MARRCMMLALGAALLSLHGDGARAQVIESDCLGDGASCELPTGKCPTVCCTGVPSRTSGRIIHCPDFQVVMRDPTPSLASADGSSASEPSLIPAISATSEEPTPSPIDGAIANADNSTTPDANSQNFDSSIADTPAPAPAPTPSSSGDSVDAFQSTQGLAGQRGGLGGSSAIFVAVGALAGCVVLVAAVMYKRKTSANTQSLQAPGSSYGGTGMTPDNRSLDGMMEGGARGTNESMKQLPVLSMAARSDMSVARLSSPFGQGQARISSPANRGATNEEDYAFDVENGSRAGSSVQVAFVDATAESVELGSDRSGVVAL